MLASQPLAPFPAQLGHRVVQDLITRAALFGEKLVSWCRLIFCALILVRFLVLAPAVPARAYMINVSAVAVAIGYSFWILWAVSHERAGPLSLRLSVVLDAAICFLSLLCTALWPDRLPHPGLLGRPDLAALLVIVYAGGFRLSASLAVLSSVLNVSSFLALVIIERQRYGTALAHGAPELFFFALMLTAAAALSVATAWRTRRLVESAAVASMTIDRARQDSTLLVREQHDARSLLNAANMHAELVYRALRPGAVGASRVNDSAEAVRLAGDLRDDLAQLQEHVVRAGERAFGQLAALRHPESIDLLTVLPAALDALRARFVAQLTIGNLEAAATTYLASLPPVSLVGGASSLQRILYNLALNAAEGDGARGAKRLTIVVNQSAAGVHLQLRDDGPGFPDAILGTSIDGCLSTKAHGSGLGLYGVARLLEMTGGGLLRTNGPDGGAVVELVFPQVISVRPPRQRASARAASSPFSQNTNTSSALPNMASTTCEPDSPPVSARESSEMAWRSSGNIP
jgi:signal transduction histidine kinase